ncbi:hypothetical protein IscW_ISCW010513 [Ixodes scapularis]|uniref:Uncharacterized protein n=1 Tax=Ixodes scapularis TaxID=6945 RepID=B7Q8E2_IXOSC|nr:hypothetical protein IscW_ISCW010513 [Ixodes scapularis]|eukprot:XP_002404966.1 hypothetical protein IscW_ISCW010513 [Ixodes scapularis]
MATSGSAPADPSHPKKAAHQVDADQKHPKIGASKITQHSRRSAARGESKTAASVQGSKAQGPKRSTSHIVPAPNLPAFAYKGQGSARVPSRQASVVDQTAEGHSRISQRAQNFPESESNWNTIIMAVSAAVILLIIVLFIVLVNMFKSSGDPNTTTTRKTG